MMCLPLLNIIIIIALYKQNKTSLNFVFILCMKSRNDRGFRINRTSGVEKQGVERRIIFGLVHKNSSLFMEPKYTAKCGSHT